MTHSKPKKVPTVASLTSRLNVSAEQAEAFRERAKAGFEIVSGQHYSHEFARYLSELGALLDYLPNSAESLYNEGMPNIWYLNAGDSYADTIIALPSRGGGGYLNGFSLCLGDIGAILERGL